MRQLRALALLPRRVLHARSREALHCDGREDRKTNRQEQQATEGGVALGREAGFDAEEALYAVRTCASYAAGYALNQIARDTQYTADQPVDSRLDITKLPPGAFPNLASVAPYYDPANRDIEFEFGLDAILTGLRAKLAARS